MNVDPGTEYWTFSFGGVQYKVDKDDLIQSEWHIQAESTDGLVFTAANNATVIIDNVSIRKDMSVKFGAHAGCDTDTGICMFRKLAIGGIQHTTDQVSLQITNPDGGSTIEHSGTNDGARILEYSYGSASIFTGFRLNGTMLNRTPVVAGQTLVNFMGAGSSDHEARSDAGALSWKVDGPIDGTDVTTPWTRNSTPTRLAIHTTKAGEEGTLQNRAVMRIDNQGLVGIKDTFQTALGGGAEWDVKARLHVISTDDDLDTSGATHRNSYKTFTDIFGTTTVGSGVLFQSTQTVPTTGGLKHSPGVQSEVTVTPTADNADHTVYAFRGLVTVPSGYDTALPNTELVGIGLNIKDSGTGASSIYGLTGARTNISNTSNSILGTTGNDFAVQANSGTLPDTIGYKCSDITTGTQTNVATCFVSSDANAVFAAAPVNATTGNTTCTVKGRMYYDDENGEFCFCNGANWVQQSDKTTTCSNSWTTD